MKIDFNNTEPIYQQIINYLLQAAARKEFQPGDRLPSVRELAEIMKVNPNTIARVYKELERDGYLEKKRGLGTFFTADEEVWEGIREGLAREAAADFTQKMQALGYSKERILTFFENFMQEGDNEW